MKDLRRAGHKEKGGGGGGGSSGDGTDFHSSIRAQGIVQLYATSPYTV